MQKLLLISDQITWTGLGIRTAAGGIPFRNHFLIASEKSIGIVCPLRQEEIINMEEFCYLFAKVFVSSFNRLLFFCFAKDINPWEKTDRISSTELPKVFGESHKT
jgi:hypothetical protein